MLLSYRGHTAPSSDRYVPNDERDSCRELFSGLVRAARNIGIGSAGNMRAWYDARVPKVGSRGDRGMGTGTDRHAPRAVHAPGTRPGSVSEEWHRRRRRQGDHIEEKSAVEYRSQTSGTMHACGHDGHTAMLLATARVLMSRRDEIAGTIVLCFQPAEEGRGGAKRMVGSGRGVGESTGRRRDGAPRDMGYEGVSGRKRTRTSLATSRPRGVRRRRTPSSCTTPSGASAANCGP